MITPQSQSKPKLDAAQLRLIAEALQITRDLTSGSLNNPQQLQELGIDPLLLD